MKPLAALLVPILLAGCREASDSPQTRTGGPLELSLATFNIRYENHRDVGWRSWPERIHRVVRVIRELDPDLLAIQEALHGQAADLRASLPDYAWVGVGRDDGQRGGEYAGILFKAARFERQAHGTFWLSDTPEVPGSKHWGNGISRCTTWVRLRDRSSGASFYTYNTHWDHRHQGSRVKSGELLLTRIDQRAHRDEPVVLMGDFNATRRNPAMRRLTGAGFTETYQHLHPHRTHRRTLHFWSGRSDGPLKVDHILVSAGAEIEKAAIQRAATAEQQPSDHFPVFAKVRWPAPTD